MAKKWILVTDNHRARIFEQDGKGPALDELVDFVYPHARLDSTGDRSGDAGKGHGRTAHGGTQFEPTTSDAEKERHSFARQLADFLNKGVAEQRCERLALIAPSPMLGEIRPLLSPASQKKLQRSVASDFTHYQGEELKHRVKEALGQPV